MNLNPTDSASINTKGVSGLVNLHVKGLVGLKSDRLTLESPDRSIKLEVPAAFAPFVSPGDVIVCAITLIRNELVPIPDAAAPSIIRPN